jgi:2-polyprenyl-3-methyl-5-hydroxy-6-metoxy-1,4-benzoquinol methylase
LTFFPDNYQERQEVGAVNFEVKSKRQETGGYFEQPLIVILNKGVAELIDENCKNILEVGSGTGIFASEASKDKTRKIIASEFNEGARKYAEMNRAKDNIFYCQQSLSDFSRNEFDLVVSIEVIEHIFDYSSFLYQLSSVAPKAIITTPNKNRNAFDSIVNTPTYGEHCREWTAGEFYWVLRVFYKKVTLYSVPNIDQQISQFLKNPDSYTPSISSVGLLTKEHLLIAKCEEPCPIF